MLWNFSGPKVIAADDHIDAACIYGQEYAKGGFCAGIKYSLISPVMWAIWFSDDDFENWTDTVGFASAVDDTEQWRTESDSFES